MSIPELTYTVLPLMFWAAVRFGPTGVSILQLVSTGAILWSALHSLVVSLDDVLPLQMFLLMLNGLSLSLAVVVRESRSYSRCTAPSSNQCLTRWPSPTRMAS